MSEIKLSNNVLISTSSVKMGIDVNNKLSGGTKDYTATQDCWAFTRTHADQYGFNTDDKTYIDGVQIGYGRHPRFPVFLKKGQRCQATYIDYVYGTK